MSDVATFDLKVAYKSYWTLFSPTDFQFCIYYIFIFKENQNHFEEPEYLIYSSGFGDRIDTCPPRWPR